MDDHNHDIDGAFHKTAVEELTRAVGPLAQLPNTHPIYSAFFKFPDGPPNTSPRAERVGRQPRPLAPARRHARGPHCRAVQQQGL